MVQAVQCKYLSIRRGFSALKSNTFRSRHKQQDCSDFVHALSIPELWILLRPYKQQVLQYFSNFFVFEERLLLLSPLHVSPDDCLELFVYAELVPGVLCLGNTSEVFARGWWVSSSSLGCVEVTSISACSLEYFFLSSPARLIQV